MTSKHRSAQAAADLDIRDLLQRAFDLLRKKPLLYVASFLIVLAGGCLTLGLALAPLLVGYIRLVDRATRGEEVQVGDVLEGLASFWPAFATGLLLTVGIAVGSLAVVVPGLVVAFVGGWAIWFVALEQRGPTDSLKASWTLVRGNVGTLLLLALATIALNLLGALVVVGLPVTMPLALIMTTLAFRDLTA